jgi:predicted GIY-YIG superfamily endonuclease
MFVKQKFNILDCFEDNIDNIDITKNYIYVLKLVEDRYYVGRTSNILRRTRQHFTSNGALYTRKYKPLKVIEVEEEKLSDDERKMTFKYVEKYGWEKVRGSYWCSLEIKRELNVRSYEKFKTQQAKELSVITETDEEIKKLYLFENKNILEIGEKMNISPGKITFRLIQLKIIKERKDAKGYDEYKNSDLYKENCKKNKETTKIEYYFHEDADNKILFDYQDIQNDIFLIAEENNIQIFEVVSLLMRHKIINKRYEARGYDKYKETEEYQSKIKNDKKSATFQVYV